MDIEELMAAASKQTNTAVVHMRDIVGECSDDFLVMLKDGGVLATIAVADKTTETHACVPIEDFARLVMIADATSAPSLVVYEERGVVMFARAGYATSSIGVDWEKTGMVAMIDKSRFVELVP